MQTIEEAVAPEEDSTGSVRMELVAELHAAQAENQSVCVDLRCVAKKWANALTDKEVDGRKYEWKKIEKMEATDGEF